MFLSDSLKRNRASSVEFTAKCVWVVFSSFFSVLPHVIMQIHSVLQLTRTLSALITDKLSCFHRVRACAGMLTITDFINILHRYYKSPLVSCASKPLSVSVGYVEKLPLHLIFRSLCRDCRFRSMSWKSTR